MIPHINPTPQSLPPPFEPFVVDPCTFPRGESGYDVTFDLWEEMFAALPLEDILEAKALKLDCEILFRSSSNTLLTPIYTLLLPSLLMDGISLAAADQKDPNSSIAKLAVLAKRWDKIYSHLEVNRRVAVGHPRQNLGHIFQNMSRDLSSHFETLDFTKDLKVQLMSSPPLRDLMGVSVTHALLFLLAIQGQRYADQCEEQGFGSRVHMTVLEIMNALVVGPLRCIEPLNLGLFSFMVSPSEENQTQKVKEAMELFLPRCHRLTNPEEEEVASIPLPLIKSLLLVAGILQSMMTDLFEITKGVMHAGHVTTMSALEGELFRAHLALYKYLSKLPSTQAHMELANQCFPPNDQWLKDALGGLSERIHEGHQHILQEAALLAERARSLSEKAHACPHQQPKP